MSLFGMFRLDKEGPGISKNAPKKRTIIVFFETFFRNFWKFIPINAVYSLIFLPQITSGFAAAGLTNVTRNIARDKHSFGISDFFETIKKNWKQALGAGIINTLVYILLFFDLYFFFKSEGAMAIIGMGISMALFFIFTVMNYFIWTLMITFKFNLKQIYKNSFKFVFINLKNNLICFFSQILVLAVYFGILFLFGSNINNLMYAVTIEMLVFILTFPAFKFLLIQFCVFPAVKKYIIDPYYEAHPDEDLDKRRDLGVYTPEEPEPSETDEDDGEDDNARVFND